MGFLGKNCETFLQACQPLCVYGDHRCRYDEPIDRGTVGWSDYTVQLTIDLVSPHRCSTSGPSCRETRKLHEDGLLSCPNVRFHRQFRSCSLHEYPRTSKTTQGITRHMHRLQIHTNSCLCHTGQKIPTSYTGIHW